MWFIHLNVENKKAETKVSALKSERRGSNSRQPAWKAGALPTELLSQKKLNKKPQIRFEALERKTRLELATTSLEGWSSTN